jgi:cobalt-zinc-cadmium efflux system membrane fusion protein
VKRTIRLAAVLLGLLVACGSKSKPEPHGHDEHAEPHQGDAKAHDQGDRLLRIDHEMLRDLRLTTARAEARAAGERVTVLGELEVNQDAYAEVAAPMAARVVRVLVGPGDTVKAGQTLVELHSPELGSARAGYQAARARADVAQRTLARQRDLAAEKLAPERELREAEAAAASADADVTVALAALRAFGPAADAGGDAARFTLRSPVAGTVIERTVVMGQLADPSRTLFRIGDLSHLWVIAHVFERDAIRVAAGGKASVAFAALPGESVEASIVLIGREVESASRTIPVRLDVPNPDGRLRPGMSATVSLPLGDAAGSVVAVPMASVQRVGDSWAVFLPREEGVFEIRAIGRGRELGGEVEVLSGLAPGEAVVVDGAFLLKAERDKARGEGGEHDHH